MIAWLETLTLPISNLHVRWKTFRDNNLYIINHNGQVVYLRAALNDSFDSEQRRIDIVDGNRFGRSYIYTVGEQKPVFLNTFFLRPASDFADTGVDFIVTIPSNVPYNLFDMTALIEFYKIASKRYKIEII